MVSWITVVIIDVIVNTRVRGRVQLVCRDTVWYGVTRSGYLEVDALGVELRTADIVGRVECQDLVAENIVARLDVGGDPDLPGEAVPDQVIGRPLENNKSVNRPVISVSYHDAKFGRTNVTSLAVASTQRNLTLLGNLEELERVLVHIGALAVAGREVVQDGALV